MLPKKTLLIVCIAFFAGSAVLAQNFKYIGAAKCKMCHIKPDKGEQYNKWLAGPHAGAMKTLANEESKKIAAAKGIADPTTDPACIKCHSTVGHIDQSLVAGIKIDEGVSCESCHGPGSMYKEVCKKCHNKESPTYKPFNFAEKAAMIAHPDPTKH
jgi:DnaJ-class molecular chaperone